MPDKQTPTGVSDYLKNLSYPANKDDLLRGAQQNGAPQDVLDQIQKLPDGQTFNNSADVDSIDNVIEASETGFDITGTGMQGNISETDIPVSYSGTGFDAVNPEEEIETDENENSDKRSA